MALPMDEQRILAEIERQLADDDPSLAARLTTFGRPGLAASLRTPRGRVLISFLAVAVVALLSLMVYSLVPFRVLPVRGTHVRATAVPSRSEQTSRVSQPATTGGAGKASRTGQGGQAGNAANGAPAAGQPVATGRIPGAGGSGRDIRTAGAPARHAASPQQARSG
jgi:hypothetical protein